MPTRTLRIVNKSSHRSARALAAVEASRQAINRQLRDVARAWGEIVYTIAADAHARGFDIVLLDDADQAGDLGYHDLDPQGRPYARVFVDPILDNGVPGCAAPTRCRSRSRTRCVSSSAIRARTTGSRTRAARSSRRSSAIPWRAARTGSRCATGAVSVSDFVYPDWFNPYVPEGTQVDYMRCCASRSRSHPTATSSITPRPACATSGVGRIRAGARRRSAPASRTSLRHRLG